MFKIWIVEDDESIRRVLSTHLQACGYETAAVTDFQDIMPAFTGFQPDLVLLDVILPAYDGFYWCGRIRTVSSVPILFMSSKDSDMDVIISSNMGGDDYLVKPFSLDLLTAKIAGLLRRTYAYQNEAARPVLHKGLLFSPESAKISGPAGEEELTKNEVRILSLLLGGRGAPVSRERLLRELWRDAGFVDDNTLTVNVTRIRKKLSCVGLPDYIETRKNEGYLV